MDEYSFRTNDADPPQVSRLKHFYFHNHALSTLTLMEIYSIYSLASLNMEMLCPLTFLCKSVQEKFVICYIFRQSDELLDFPLPLPIPEFIDYLADSELDYDFLAILAMIFIFYCLTYL